MVSFIKSRSFGRMDPTLRRRQDIYPSDKSRSWKAMEKMAMNRGYNGASEVNQETFTQENVMGNSKRGGVEGSSSTRSCGCEGQSGCGCGSSSISYEGGGGSCGCEGQEGCTCGQNQASYVNNFCQTGPSMGHQSIQHHDDCQTPIDSGFMQSQPSHMHVGSTHHISQPAKHFHKDVKGKDITEHYESHSVSENECWNGGVLVYINNQGGTGCICHPKYMGNRCHEVNPCYQKPCKCGMCTAAGNGKFSCACCPEKIGPTCGKENPCPPGYCGDNGVCTHDGTKPSCTCQRGFAGPRCEVLNTCYPNPCENDGQCVLTRRKRHIGRHMSKSDKPITDYGYQCLCKGAYHGGTCAARNKCAENPCKNGAKCEESGDSYKCTCGTGFKGKNCDEKPCSPNPCANRGMCSETSSGYTCQCPQYALGYNCDKTSPCNAKPCLNAGKCVDSMSGYQWGGSKTEYVCICPIGYGGDHCQDAKSLRPKCHPDAHIENNHCVCDDGFAGDGINKCDKMHQQCTPNPCLNDGECMPAGSTFECKCKEGFSGEHCQTVNPCEPNPCNGHQCMPNPETGYTCNCGPGAVGKNCQDVDVCFIKKPCKNSGSCSLSKNKDGFTCGCMGKWSGPTCQECKCTGGSKCNSQGICVCEPTEKFVDGKCKAIAEIEKEEKEKKDEEAKKAKAAAEAAKAGVSTPESSSSSSSSSSPTSSSSSSSSSPKGLPGPSSNKPDGWCAKNNPCRNGGTCVEDAEGTFQTCICVEEDQEPTNYCIKREMVNPCHNGGIYVPLLKHGFDCKCMARYHGPTCEVDKCALCSTDAICNNGVCHCAEGFTGSGYVCVRDDYKPTEKDGKDGVNKGDRRWTHARGEARGLPNNVGTAHSIVLKSSSDDTAEVAKKRYLDLKKTLFARGWKNPTFKHPRLTMKRE